MIHFVGTVLIWALLIYCFVYIMVVTIDRQEQDTTTTKVFICLLVYAFMIVTLMTGI